MIWRSCRRNAEAHRWTRRAACVLVAALAWSGADALAVTFYKWIDESGEVHYGDAPPKQYAATAKRIEVDPGAHRVAPVLKPPAAEEPVAAAAPPAAPDILTQRRQTRARLEKNLEQARERLDLAQKALAETVSPQEDEWQTTVGQVQAPGPGQIARSNCHAGPNNTVICPGRVPTEQYYQRLEKLQDDVHAAELAVEDAERAYRQGVD